MTSTKQITTVAAALGVLALAGCGTSHEISKPPMPKPVLLSATPSSPATGPTVTADGVGTVTGQPDTVTIQISVSTTAPHAAAALAQNNAITGAVQSALRKDGIAKPDLQTSGLSVQENWTPSGPNGYAVTDGISATIRNLARAGTIIDDALAPAGDAGRLDYMNLSIANDESLMAGAKAQAVSSAQAQAARMAAAAGGHLGALVSLTDTSTHGNSIYPQAFQGVSSAAAAPVPIQAGSEQMTVTVAGVWQFVPGA
jgi:uncharacterized protein YggE